MIGQKYSKCRCLIFTPVEYYNYIYFHYLCLIFQATTTKNKRKLASYLFLLQYKALSDNLYVLCFVEVIRIYKYVADLFRINLHIYTDNLEKTIRVGVISPSINTLKISYFNLLSALHLTNFSILKHCSL